jgi:hypothetical protein
MTSWRSSAIRRRMVQAGCKKATISSRRPGLHPQQKRSPRFPRRFRRHRKRSERPEQKWGRGEAPKICNPRKAGASAPAPGCGLSSRGALLLLLRLQAVQKVRCPLRVRCCAEDGAFVFLQHVEPVPEIGGVVVLPALISVSIALCFICALAIESRRGLAKRLLVVTEPSSPAVLLRDNPAPDEPLRGLSKVSLVAQDRLRISQFVVLQHRMALYE